MMLPPSPRNGNGLAPARFAPQRRGNAHDNRNEGPSMSDRAAIAEAVYAQIAPFNKKDIALTDAATFAGDLEWDSLTVMDFVAAIEDEFDIVITMNMQAEIETVGQLIDAVAKLTA
jgi:acyl carrier protein